MTAMMSQQLMAMNYIKTYDNVIPDDICDQLVKTFEVNPEQHEDIQLEGHRSFQQVNLQQNEGWEFHSKFLQVAFNKYVGRYKHDCNITDMMFPPEYAFEMFRMKRYLPNDKDEFSDHVDVGNQASAKRFLVFFLYLNEPQGGETEFPQFNVSVKPKKGSMLMFPPMWTHLHAGRKVTGNEPKYIVGSYLHYI